MIKQRFVNYNHLLSDW